MDRKENKIHLLKEILKRKNVLFGAFSQTITKDRKNAAWAEIHNFAQALGLVPSGKDYCYTRDVLWQNIKKSSMKKRDNCRQTGSGGQAKINKIDEFVYEIIGKESPVLDGLNVAESAPPSTSDHTFTAGPSCSNPAAVETAAVSGSNSAAVETPVALSSSNSAAVETPVAHSGSTFTAAPHYSNSRKKVNVPKSRLEHLRETKLSLTIKYLELKIKLLEKQLGEETDYIMGEEGETEHYVEEYLDSDIDID